jgi:hypothetical protein
MSGDGAQGPPQAAAAAVGAVAASTATVGASSRHVFRHAGRDIYEWEQNLDEVLVYVRPPEGVRAAHIACTIKPGRVTLGLKGAPHPFIDEDLAAKCAVAESLWQLEDGTLTLTLTKALKGETWPSVFVGHASLDPLTAAEDQKRMLLERFTQEHPGFDFSGAEVNGAVPDPRTFLGGIARR